MKGKSKFRLPHLRPAHPHLRVPGWFLSENAAMPPGQQVKVHKSASFVDILEVCKFTTFCDRKGYIQISIRDKNRCGATHVTSNNGKTVDNPYNYPQ